VKKQDSKNLRNRKRRIFSRLAPKNWADQQDPFFQARNVSFEMAGRARSVIAGGIGAIHHLVRKVGLVEAINEALPLLKRHLPYHESDHVLNIAFNVMAGHTRLEDLEVLRHDEAYMDMLGAQRIPDPTTAGDFLRRFSRDDIITLMETVNRVRQQIWTSKRGLLGQEAIIDVDGTMVPTLGEKKHGMEYSYKGIWCYHPLLVSLANTQEPLYIINRPGNCASHEDSATWLDRAVDLARPVFGQVLLRGDTDFSLTTNFDRWTQEGVGFVFGYDAKQNLVEHAESLKESAWSPFLRPSKREVLTEPREKRENIKDQIIKGKKWRTLRQRSEEISDFMYTPARCKNEYRIIVIRKNIGVEKGERYLFDDIRYYFYVTNRFDLTPDEVVRHANARCHQENLIEQLKNGVNALRVPVYDLDSNWSYMVIASLAWTFKAWFALSLPTQKDSRRILAMEFKGFLHSVILIPCQVIKGGRKIKLRIMGWTEGVRLLFQIMRANRKLVPS